jgi:high-affinity K+ transport system ATPase subunit B
MDAFAAARVVVRQHPRLHSPHRAMLSAIINALIIVALLPLGLRGLAPPPSACAAMSCSTGSAP